MSMPTIPNLESTTNISTIDALNIVIASIAFEGLGLAHIINAEGEKIQSFLGTLEGQTVKSIVTISDLESLDNIVNQTLSSIVKKEILLLMKLEAAMIALKKAKANIVPFN